MTQSYRPLLEIVQRASKRLLLPVPTTVIGNTDAGVLQMVELLQEETDDSLSDHDWNTVITPLTITSTGVNYTAQTFPSDYDRMLKDGKIIRTLNRTELIGPIQSDEWIKITLYNATIVTGCWRIFGGNLNIYGIATGDTVATEYISDKWIISNDGLTTKSNWTADTDQPRIDDSIFRLGLIWRWKRAKGLDFEKELDAYNAQKEQLVAHDRGLRTVPLARSLRSGLPENFWPGSVVVTP